MREILLVHWSSAYGHNGSLKFYSHGRAEDERTGELFWYHTDKDTLYLSGRVDMHVQIKSGYSSGVNCLVYDFPEDAKDKLDSSDRAVCVISNTLYLDKDYSAAVESCDVVVRVNSCLNYKAGVVGKRTDVVVITDNDLTTRLMLGEDLVIDASTVVIVNNPEMYNPLHRTEDIDRYSGGIVKGLRMPPECAALHWAKSTLHPGKLFVLGSNTITGAEVLNGIDLPADDLVKLRQYREHKESVTGARSVLLADQYTNANIASAFFYDGQVIVHNTRGVLMRKGKLLAGDDEYLQIDWGESVTDYYYNGRFFEVVNIKYCVK
jgi:phosphohistidine swiveling domain-containing protein